MSLISHTNIAKSGFGNNIYGNKQEEGPSEYFTDKNIIAKYSELLKTDEDHIRNHYKLYEAIDFWMGTPYKAPGYSKSGIDCSGLVRKLFETVYNIKIKPTSLQQFCDTSVALFTNRRKWQLGDLIFFKTPVSTINRFNRVTHVGLYLTNGYFVQSSSSGVNIANLESVYWRNNYVAAGRLKNSYYLNAKQQVPEGEIKAKIDFEVAEDSKFEFVPSSEDLEYVIRQYSDLMKVDRSKIEDYPEVFNFIEINRYAPQNIISRCPGKLPGNNCLLSILFKDVFNFDLEEPEKPDFFNNYTSYQGSDKMTNKFFLDLIKLKSENKNKKDEFLGIYLYNNYFLHIFDGDISISSLNDPVYQNKKFGIYRLKTEISKAINSNLMEKRKGAEQAP